MIKLPIFFVLIFKQRTNPQNILSEAQRSHLSHDLTSRGVLVYLEYLKLLKWLSVAHTIVSFWHVLTYWQIHISQARAVPKCQLEIVRKALEQRKKELFLIDGFPRSFGRLFAQAPYSPPPVRVRRAKVQ